MGHGPVFQFIMWFKLLVVFTGFVLTIYAQVSDIDYDQRLEDIENIDDPVERLEKRENIIDGHQLVTTLTLIALTLLFLETISTSSVQLYLYYFNGTETGKIVKRLNKIETILKKH
jgi:hypothetical protein